MRVKTFDKLNKEITLTACVLTSVSASSRDAILHCRAVLLKACRDSGQTPARLLLSLRQLCHVVEDFMPGSVRVTVTVTVR